MTNETLSVWKGREARLWHGMPSTSSLAKPLEARARARDLAAFDMLRASLGADTLNDVLQAHLVTTDELCEALETASRREEWQNAARLALDLAGSAVGLGFDAVTAAARSFAAAAHEKADVHALRNRLQMVVFEHERLRLAIELAFPELLV